jgi:hypothetical protein
MSPVPDITESEHWAVETTLRENWPDDTPETRLADVEIRMFPTDRELTVCHAMFWEHDTQASSSSRLPIKPAAASFTTAAFNSTERKNLNMTTLPIAL